MDTTELTTSASEASQVVGAQRTHDLTPDLVRQMGQRESFLCLLMKNNILFATPSLSGCGSLKVVVVFVSVLGAPLPPRPADAAKQCEESFEGALKRPPHHHACRLPRASPAPLPTKRECLLRSPLSVSSIARITCFLKDANSFNMDFLHKTQQSNHNNPKLIGTSASGSVFPGKKQVSRSEAARAGLGDEAARGA